MGALGFLYLMVGGGLWWKVSFDNDITYDWTWSKVALLGWGLSGMAGAGLWAFDRFPSLQRLFRPSLWAQTEEDVNNLYLLPTTFGLPVIGGLLLVLGGLGLFSPLFNLLDRIPHLYWVLGLGPMALFLAVGFGRLMVCGIQNVFTRKRPPVPGTPPAPVLTPESRKVEVRFALSLFFGLMLPMSLCMAHFFAFDSASQTTDWQVFSNHTQGQEHGFVETWRSRSGIETAINYGPLSLASVAAELDDLQNEHPDFEDRIGIIKARRDPWFGRKILNVTDAGHHVWATEGELSRDSCKMAVRFMTDGYEIVAINGHAFDGNKDSGDTYCTNLMSNHVKVRSLPDYFP
jgi:hypothetical protein